MADDFDIYLASASPRRRELLTQIGVSYSLLTVDLDETPLPGEAALDYVSRLALAKAEAGWQLREGLSPKPVLGADTAVVIDGQILGKPADQQQALAMLQQLSGRTHQVMSAVAVVQAGHREVAVNTSFVTFRDLSSAECLAYWHTGEPRDKAGSYAVQGRGAIFIQKLEGSYSDVMGLPLYESAELLQNVGVTVLNHNNN